MRICWSERVGDEAGRSAPQKRALERRPRAAPLAALSASARRPRAIRVSVRARQTNGNCTVNALVASESGPIVVARVASDASAPQVSRGRVGDGRRSTVCAASGLRSVRRCWRRGAAVQPRSQRLRPSLALLGLITSRFSSVSAGRRPPPARRARGLSLRSHGDQRGDAAGRWRRHAKLTLGERMAAKAWRAAAKLLQVGGTAVRRRRRSAPRRPRARKPRRRVEHRVEEAFEALHVASHHVRKRAHRPLAEEQAEHAANVIGHERHAGGACRWRSGRPSGAWSSQRGWHGSPLRSRRASVASPAAIASGLPDSVPAWYTGPSGAMRSMISRRPPNAPTGMPPPIDLAERREVRLDADTAPARRRARRGSRSSLRRR